MNPQGSDPQSNALLQMLGGGAGAGPVNPMSLMGLPGMGGPQMPGTPGMAGPPGMAMGGMPGGPMGPQLPPGLEGLGPEQIQMLLMMLQQQGFGGPSLQEMLGGEGGPMAGAAAPMGPDDMSLMPGAAGAAQQSY